jgi:hypothetical protein
MHMTVGLEPMHLAAHTGSVNIMDWLLEKTLHKSAAEVAAEQEAKAAAAAAVEEAAVMEDGDEMPVDKEEAKADEDKTDKVKKKKKGKKIKEVRFHQPNFIYITGLSSSSFYVSFFFVFLTNHRCRRLRRPSRPSLRQLTGLAYSPCTWQRVAAKLVLWNGSCRTARQSRAKTVTVCSRCTWLHRQANLVCANGCRRKAHKCGATRRN